MFDEFELLLYKMALNRMFNCVLPISIKSFKCIYNLTLPAKKKQKNKLDAIKNLFYKSDHFKVHRIQTPLFVRSAFFWGSFHDFRRLAMQPDDFCTEFIYYSENCVVMS